MLWLRGAPGAVPVQRRDVSDVQLLPEHQELLGDQDHLRLHLAAGDHRRLRHAVARCGRAAEKGTSRDCGDTENASVEPMASFTV